MPYAPVGVVAERAKQLHETETDGSVLGGELDTVTLGLNWYPNDNIRFIANYIHADTDENAVTPDDGPEVYLLRGQFAF